MESNLDLMNKKILAELDFNARIFISKLAKKLRISRQTCSYRIENLEKNRFILNYTAIINAQKLGYRYCRILFKFQSLNKKLQKQVIDFCNHPEIAFLAIIDGYWDLGIGYWAKDLVEFEKFIDNFIYNFGHYILDKRISIGLHVWQFQHRYLLNKEETKEFYTGGKLENEFIDDTDKKLLILLTKNARTPLINLSRELNLTPKAIIYRIKKLMKKNILLGYRCQINYRKFNYMNNKVFLFLQNLTKEKETNLFQYLKRCQNCIYITKALGEANLEFEILSKDEEEFFIFMQELKEKFGDIIKNYDRFIIHEELISHFAPLK